MAEIDLGKISFTFKGVYASTTYESKDVVQYTMVNFQLLFMLMLHQLQVKHLQQVEQ